MKFALLFRLLLTIGIFYLGSASMFSQTPNFFTIGEDEFVGVDIYSITKYNDLLYVSTNNGVYKQSNNSFVKLPITEASSISLFDLQTDNQNNLYCKSLSGFIYKLEQDSLVPFYTLDNKYFTSNFYFFFDRSNRLIIAGDEVIRVSDGKIENLTETLFTSKKKHRHTSYSHKMYNGDIFMSAAVDSAYAYIYDHDNLHLYQYGKNKLEGGDMHLWCVDSSKYLFDFYGNVFSESNSEINLTIQPKSRFFDLDRNVLLVLGEKAGAQILSVHRDTLVEVKSFFDDQYISFAFKDDNGVLYLGTFGDGILVIPNYQQKKITLNKKITGIARSVNNIPVFSTWDGFIYAHTKAGLVPLEEVQHKIDDIFYNPVPIGDNFQKDSKLLYSTLALDSKLGSIKDVYVASDSLTFIAAQSGVYVLSSTKLVNNFFDNFNKVGENIFRYKEDQRFKSVAYSSNIELILACNEDGIVNLESNQIYKVNEKPLAAKKIRFYSQTLVASTNNHGLYFIENNKISDSLNVVDGLLSNQILDFELYQDLIIILSKKGIQVYDLVEESLHNVNSSHGWVEETVLDFGKIDSSLWLASKNSIYEISLAAVLSLPKMPVISIDSVLVNDNSYSLKNEFYQHNQNSFKFKLGLKDFVIMKDAYWVYQLEGLDNQLNTMKADAFNVDYKFLPPGDYNFKVALEYNNRRSEFINYPFRIELPLYQKWWFLLLIMLLIIGCVILIAKLRITSIKKKNRERLEKEILSKNLLDSELKALRSQMNPHFIFNSLNSIQNLVLKQEVDKSYDFIEKFAELVRNTLNYSEQEFISIDKELRFLEVYLDLEKLRFKDDFIYTVKNNCPSSTELPSLLVQPFIENALKHGLIHKKGIKELYVTFDLNDVLTCTIRDNGIGRREAAKIGNKKRNEHISFSMKAINKRLDILSQQYQGDFYYEIRDLYENGKSSGTEIRLYIPSKKSLIN